MSDNKKPIITVDEALHTIYNGDLEGFLSRNSSSAKSILDIIDMLEEKIFAIKDPLHASVVIEALHILGTLKSSFVFLFGDGEEPKDGGILGLSQLLSKNTDVDAICPTCKRAHDE